MGDSPDTDSIHLELFGRYIDVPLHEMEMAVLLPLLFVTTFIWDRAIVHDLLWASSVHAAVVTVIAGLNLYYSINEVYIFILMAGYFLADSVRCFLNGGSKVYLFHHGLTVFALWYMITQPHLASDFYASKSTIVELSTPFMNRYMTTQRMIDGVLFTIAFFGVRVAWLGYLGYTALDVLVHTIEYVIIAAFLGLNWFWFGQIMMKAYEALTGNHVPYTEERGASDTNVEEKTVKSSPTIVPTESATLSTENGLRLRKLSKKNPSSTGNGVPGEDPCGWVQSCGSISDKVVTDTKQAIARTTKMSANSPTASTVF